MLRELLSHRRLIAQLALTDLRGRYSGSALGVAWTVIQPLVMIVMYTTLFAVVLKVRVGTRGDVTDFGLFLIAGLLGFSPVGDAVRRSCHAYRDGAHLMRRIVMAPVALPAARVLTAFVEQAISLALFLILLVLLGRPPGPSLLALALLLPLQAALGCGLGVALASMAVLVRDLGALAESILAIWFLATPVIYPREMLPPGLREMIDANPLTPLVEGYRAVLLGHRLPPLADLGYIASVALFALLAGAWVYRRTRTTIIDHV